MKSTLKRLDTVHQRLTTALSGVDPELLAKRPAENEWSVAEVVHHLCLVEERVLDDMRENLQQPPAKGGLLKRLLPMRIVSLRLKRVEAPDAVRPPSNPPPIQEVMQNYDRFRANLKQLCVDEGRGRLRQIRFKHPVFGYIDGVAAVSMLGFHEQRHLKQIREILKKVEH